MRSASCCCCYSFYHYCFRFDKVVHVVVVIWSAITVQGLTEEWFMLLVVILSTISV
jgi:heterodisulfide reductase subunit C